MPASLVIPAPDTGWSVISGERVRERGIELAEAGRKHAELVVGIPSNLVSTFTVELPPVESALVENMVYAQAEKRGLLHGSAGETRIDFEALGETAAGDVTYAVAVASGIGEDQIIASASGYQVAAALRPIPAGGAALWREHGRLVFGLYDSGRLLHLQVLSGAREVGAAAASEISLALLGLEGDPVLGDRLPDTLELQVEEGAGDDRHGFRRGLKIPVEERDPADLVFPKPRVRGRLLPDAVSRARSRGRLRRRLLLAGGVVLVAYLVLVSFFWVHSRRTAERIESLERQISIVEPDVERIQAVEQRWSRLEPAFDKKWFPIVQLSRITSALPGSGVVIREFRTNGRGIRVVGQARDVQLAKRLLDDLEGMTDLSHYRWNMPNPTVQQNNTANFTIEGTPKNAPTDS